MSNRIERAVLLALVVATVLLSTLPMSASAGVVRTWTTTADWDGGTKSSDSQAGALAGNHVETTTDDPAVFSGAVELASVKGDAFEFADADADTWRWDTCGGTTNIVTRDVASGAFRLSTSGDVSGTGRGIQTRALALTGDLDVRVTLDKVSSTGTPFARFQLANEDISGDNCDISDSATVDGAFIQYEVTGASTYNLAPWTQVNGAQTACGGVTGLTIDPVYLRIQRSVNVWTFGYSSDGSAWTDIQSCSAVAGGGLMTYLYNIHTTVALSGLWDNYNVVTGTLTGTGAVRTSGTWTSEFRGMSSGWSTILRATVSYSNAAASSFIDSFAITIDYSDGAITDVTCTDNTDVTSGTSATYECSGSSDSSASAQVSIVLAGNGASTVSIENVLLEDIVRVGGDQPPQPFTGADGTTNFVVTYPNAPLIPILDIFDPRDDACFDVMFSDVRPEAALADLYIWDFGDNNTTTTVESSVRHHYSSEGEWTVLVRVYAKGAVTVYTTKVSTVSGSCSTSNWVYNILLPAVALTTLAVAAILVAFRRRLGPRLKKWLLRVFVAGLIILAVLVAYASIVRT